MKTTSRSFRPLLLVSIGILLILAALAFYLLNPLEQAVAPLPTAALGAEGSFPEVPRVSQGDAKAAYDLKSAVFIDTRGHEYYKEGHIPGALSIPLDEMVQRLSELNKEDWIITYCTWPNEETSARAARMLLDHGFTQVMPLKGGLEAWETNNYPMEK